MAIQPPTDLVLDVARAADPEKLKAAANRLKAIAQSSALDAPDFDNTFDTVTNDLAAGGTRPHHAADVTPIRTSLRAKAAMAASLSPARQFEALILQQFIEVMLPQDAETVFGEGTAGDIWKSMMAEQISKQVVSAGGVGISEIVEKTITSAKA
ncbi:rod-binding protein [Breoghania sp.]|uniref:rod-binding protein n=1 Tax=Breoghania sp. TaxID=2065378 RepID=UPI002AAB8C6E|nr:rod-binding protein [Breoghania sp.]